MALRLLASVFFLCSSPPRRRRRISFLTRSRPTANWWPMSPTALKTLISMRFVRTCSSSRQAVERNVGYRPRPAAQVLTTRYGDCKDKSNLMRALLSSLGIESHLMVLSAEASWPVPLEWPSPLHFDHCILAICADGFSYSNAVATHPHLGRLLLFDPTDEFLPLGRARRQFSAAHLRSTRQPEVQFKKAQQMLGELERKFV